MIDVRSPEEIWKAYDAGRSYKSNIDLYETVEDNERFYIGDQWHGLNAPNIPKPVLNVLKRTVSMLVAKICSDDIAANITPFLKDEASEERTKMMSNEVDKVLELTDIKMLGKRALRNAAVDGDGCIYTYWDGDAPTGQDSKGAIRAELIDNINVIFDNPHTTNVDGQRYIIIARRLPVEEVRERAKANGVQNLELIVADTDTNQYEQGTDNTLVTLLTVLYKQDTVHAVEATEKCIVRKEWDTELKRYPVAWLPWERQRNCMHGRAALTDMIPNQIAINKAYAGMLRVIERYGFPTRVINRNFVKDWDGTPGRVIKVEAGQNVDVRTLAADIEGASINPSISTVIGEIISYTKDFMGTNDASMGDVRPDNASAIIALQNADTIPLELIRQSYNLFLECVVRNIVDMMHANYGVRLVEKTVTDPLTGKPTTIADEYDFEELNDENLRVSVDIGAASMWSEITQIDSLNALFTSGIMDDPRKFRLYIEIVPDKYVPGKAKLLQWCDEMEAQMNAQMNPHPNETPTGGELLNPYGDLPMGNINDAPTIGQEGMYPNV